MVLLLLLVFMPALASAQELGAAGPGPVAPIRESPAAATQLRESRVSAISTSPPPRGYAEDIQAAKKVAVGAAPGLVQSDRPRPALSPDGGLRPEAPAIVTSFDGIDYTGWIPPDGAVAAGPTSLVLSVNGAVTIRNKTGVLVASTSLISFWGAQASEAVFDPRVAYDAEARRFFVAAVGRIANTSCVAGVSCVSHFYLAVSKSSSPATTGPGDWFFYAFDATLDGSTPTSNWADYTGLGIDESVVVLTANMFSFGSSAFQYAKVRTLSKSALIAGSSVMWFDFWNLTDPGTGFKSFTVQPAFTFGAPGPFFLVSKSSISSSCDLIVRGIANALSSPTLSALVAAASGGSCTAPPDATQPGGGTPLDSGDSRLTSAAYRNGSLWTAQSIGMNFGSGAVAAIRWAQVDVSHWPISVSLVQDGTFGQDGTWYMFPAATVDAANDLGIAFTRASATEFASASYTARSSTDPANTLQPSALIRAGEANYQRLTGGVNRWGDYSAVAVDPADGSFWVFAEYAASSTTWGMWVGNFAAPTSSPATIASPTPGSTLAGATVTFAWAAGSGATQYWLSIGTAGVGSNNIYAQSQGIDLSATVTVLPVNGSTVYVRLWSLLGGSSWQFNDYTYAAASQTRAVLTSPAPGSTLPGATVTFTWAAGAGATQYWLSIGTAGVGSNNIYAQSQGTSLSAIVTVLPVNGSTVYVRLWSLLGGSSWQFNDYTYTAATPARAVLTSPAPGSTLSGATATFTWTAGNGATQYWLSIGTMGVGSNNLYAQTQGTNLSATVTVLPVDGSTVHVRLWSLLGGSSWQFNDYTYTAATPTRAVLTSPAPGSTLSGATVTFTWTVGAGATQYWLSIGTMGVGSNNLYAQSQGTNLTATVTVLPVDGSTVYVRLWSLLGGSSWQFNDYTHTAATPTRAVLTSPAPGSTLSGATATFTWTVGAGATQYWLSIGTMGVGSNNLYAQSQGTNLAATVTVLPVNGGTVYVRLWSLLGGSSWQFNDYAFTAFAPMGGSGAYSVLMSITRSRCADPANNGASTISGSLMITAQPVRGTAMLTGSGAQSVQGQLETDV